MSIACQATSQRIFIKDSFLLPPVLHLSICSLTHALAHILRTNNIHSILVPDNHMRSLYILPQKYPARDHRHRNGASTMSASATPTTTTRMLHPMAPPTLSTLPPPTSILGKRRRFANSPPSNSRTGLTRTCEANIKLMDDTIVC